MKYLRQFGIILFISFIGEILHYAIPLPVPASIYGIIIMFAVLKTKVFDIDEVKETGMFLVEIMPIMFIPAAVGLINTWSVIAPMWIQYVSITVITTCMVIVVSGRVTQAVIRHKNHK